ncbi:hypothetical protein EDD22DRAFT_142001 [Suillus occidentalis]|nr:hypothetical protein EDD22DRAFT_142001 [Suillus occidentalis]
MHRTFYSEDIIYSALRYLKRKDLKNVAMTCSRLAGPTLDILWSKRSSLVSLIMCLPQDTLEIKDNTIHLSREPTPSEWGRLRINVSRVRRLLVPDPDSQEALWTYRAPKLSVSGPSYRGFSSSSLPPLSSQTFAHSVPTRCGSLARTFR